MQQIKNTIFLVIIFLLFSSHVILAQESLSPNEPIDGTLENTQESIAYTFSGNAGAIVTIAVSSRDFDTYLRLDNTAGESLAENDDFGGSLNSTIDNLTLPEDGDYTVHVSSADGDAGDFQLTLTIRSVNRIEYGETITGELTENVSSVQYEFEGVAGDIILVDLQSSSFDTFLELTDEFDITLATDDDGGVSTNSLIAGYELPQSGTYIIKARGFSPNATGNYSLQLLLVAITTLEPNTSILDTLDNALNVYEFSAEYGDKISVDIIGEDGIDTALLLRAPSGYVLVNDDDSGEDLNPEIHNLYIQEAGTYSLIVQSVDTQVTGQYQLNFKVAELTPLECDSNRILEFSAKDPNKVFSFDSSTIVDETFDLIFTIEDTQITGIDVRVYQLGIQTAPLEDEFNDNQLTRRFVALNDPQARIIISDYRSMSISMEVICP